MIAEFKKLFALFTKKEKTNLVFIILIVLVNSLLDLLTTLCIGISINKAISGNAKNFRFSLFELLNSQSLNFLIIVTIVMVAVRFAFSFFAVWMQEKYVRGFHHRLGMDLVEKYLHAGLPFHSHVKSSTLIRNLQIELHQLVTGVVGPFIRLLSESCLCIMYLSFLFYTNWIITCVIIVAIGMVVVLYNSITKSVVNKHRKQLPVYRERQIEVLQTMFGAIVEIKTFGVEKIFKKRYNKVIDDLMESNLKTQLVSKVYPSYLEFMILSLALGALLYLTGKSNTTELLGFLVVLVLSLLRFKQSTSSVMGGYTAIKVNMPSVDHIYKDYTSLNITALKETPSLIQRNKELLINIDQLNFSYTNNTSFTLQCPSVSINKGDKVLIVGESGSGKTTFMNILLGLLPVGNMVTVNGQSISEWMNDNRFRTAYVPQHIFLINESILFNITFGKEDIDKEQLAHILNAAALTQFIEKSDEGYHKNVGENGKNISGGQRQRLGIARALYRKPEILFLDEATSALDEETAAEVMKNITSDPGNTVIMITHNKDFKKYFDKIFEVRNGKVGVSVNSPILNS